MNIWTCDHRKENEQSPPEHISKINHINYYIFENYEGTHLNSRIYGFNLEFLNGLFITAILHGKQSKFSLSYINESEKTQSKYV